MRGVEGIGGDRKNKIAEKRASARPGVCGSTPRTSSSGAKPSSPLANPQSDSNPSSLAKVENSDSEWLVVDKHRDILIENPEIQNADSMPSYSTHIGRSRSAATTPKSRSEFLETDFALPSREQTAHLLVPGKAHSHTVGSASVPSSPVLGNRSASMPPKSPVSLVGENARSIMLRSMLPDPPSTAIRNVKSSRSSSLAPSTVANDAAVAATSGALGAGKRSESTPVSSLHPTLSGKVSTTPASDQRRRSGCLASTHVHVATSVPVITQQINVVSGEAYVDGEEEEGEEDDAEEYEEEGEDDDGDAVNKLTLALHKFNLRMLSKLPLLRYLCLCSSVPCCFC